MSKRIISGLLLTSGVLLSALAGQKKSKNSFGSRNHQCPMCSIGQNMEMEKIQEIMETCSLHFSEDVMSEVLRPDYSLLKGSANQGSLAKEDKTIRSLRSAIGSGLTQEMYNAYLILLSDFPNIYPDLSGAFFDLLEKLKPYEYRLLWNMEFTDSKGNFAFAKNMVKMCSVIGSRSFINRYLQRNAIVVPHSVAMSDLIQKKELWVIDWVCNNREKNLDQVIDEIEGTLNETYQLDFARERIYFVFDKDKDKFTSTRLSSLESVQKLAEVAWFIEVAKACGIKEGKELLYTYPVENIFTEKRYKDKIGDTVFSKVTYKLHVPYGKGGCPQTEKSFAGATHEFVKDPKITQPYLYFYDKANTNEAVAIVYYSYTSGSGTILRSNVFTHTEKMNSISFSIPAGSPQYGGSCISSAYSATGPNQENTICRSCYALKGNYLFVQYVFTSAPRMNWLVETLESDPTGTTLAYYMSLAIESYARYGTSAKRNKLEFGFIREEKLVYPTGKNSVAEFAPVNLRIPGKTSQDWINKTLEGSVAGYFRLHDSGDFTVSIRQGINVAYIASWGMVAETFQNVKFWAPTRNWTTGFGDVEDSIIINDKGLQAAFAQITKGIGKEVFDQLGLGKVVSESNSIWWAYVNMLNTICEENSNLIIRPSGLTVINPFNRGYIKVPMLGAMTNRPIFLSAGTGVNAVFIKGTSKNAKRFMFTDSGFESIAFNTAYPPRTKGRNDIKAKIGRFISRYFQQQYAQAIENDPKSRSKKKIDPQKVVLPVESYTIAESTDGTEVWQCPVNLKTDKLGKKIKSADSCLGVKCRYCWINKDGPVTYGAH